MISFKEFQEAMDLSFISGAKSRGSVEYQKKARAEKETKQSTQTTAPEPQSAGKVDTSRGYGKGRYMGDSVEIDDILIENTGTYAHYYGTKAKGYTVRITDSMQPVGGKVIPVDGKSHAKKVAKEHNAQQWNF